ncbi:MAG: aminotransferase class I/II-fold pyridoxal phosphate-dependent enzyme [Tepidanaerobacteraceae bacterium]|nr:aminotransferase class I/II-fold pyridoxal phosphate-dependent enzyme [Tepidanaerobacteraceae bacterium]
MKRNLDMPLVRALRRYVRKDPARFHMPGHKGSGRFYEDFGEPFKKNLFKWDVTELAGLDNLHEPDGAIKKAEERLARIYGADKSFFLVNGSTSGMLAMMGAALNPGDSVIVSRASHRSVLSGLILTGAKPVYLMPEWHEGLGVYTQITPEALCGLINQNREAKAIVIANPTYQGFCPDLKAICETARKNKMLVLADEAHGPHLAFSPHLPSSAGDCGADAWVQSPHKMLFSLTQSAWLHVKGAGMDKEKLSTYIGMVTSTSPSYILMASLDYTAALMESRGKHIVEKALNLAEKARDFINRNTCFYCIGDELKGKEGIFDIDLSRLMINVSETGFTGFEVEHLLRRKYSIYAEYADLCNVYFLVTSGNTKKDIARLMTALMDISNRRKKYENKKTAFGKNTANARELFKELSAVMKRLPQKAMEPKDAFFSAGEWITLNHAVGRIVKKALVPYPPGVPLLMPGEILEKEHIAVIERLRKEGCSIHGMDCDQIFAAII